MDERELIKRWMKWKSDRDGVQYTFRAIAEEAGLNPNYLSNVMTGVRNPGRKTLSKIASALDITMSEFYSGPPAGHALRPAARPAVTAVVEDNTAAAEERPEPPVQKPVPEQRHEPQRLERQRLVSQSDSKEKFGLKLTGNATAEFDKLFTTLGFEASDIFVPKPQTAFPREVSDLDACDLGDDAALQEEVGKGGSGEVSAAGKPDATSPHPQPAQSRSAEESWETSRVIPLLERSLSGDVTARIDDYHRLGRKGFKSIPRYFGVAGRHVFALYVNDKSMFPDLDDGDLLIVNPDIPFNNTNGGIGVVHDGDEFKVRRIFMKSGNFLLVPSNSLYEPEIASKDKVRILKIVQWIPRAENKF